MKIEILGSNCKKCKKLEEVVRKVVAENNIDATIEKVKDTKKIIEYGVMTIPALVIDGKVKSSGKLLSERQVLNLIGCE
jgi:small redox-active disulfide protein 2